MAICKFDGPAQFPTTWPRSWSRPQQNTCMDPITDITIQISPLSCVYRSQTYTQTAREICQVEKISTFLIGISPEFIQSHRKTCRRRSVETKPRRSSAFSAPPLLSSFHVISNPNSDFRSLIIVFLFINLDNYIVYYLICC